MRTVASGTAGLPVPSTSLPLVITVVCWLICMTKGSLGGVATEIGSNPHFDCQSYPGAVDLVLERDGCPWDQTGGRLALGILLAVGKGSVGGDTRGMNRPNKDRRGSPMSPSRQLPPLDSVATAIAGLLDIVDGVQCWIKDREGRYRWVNRGFLHNYAVERLDDVVGRTDHDLSPAHLADQYRLDDDRVLRGEPVDRRIELVGRFDRTAAWSQTTKQPLRDGRGRIVGTVGMTRVVDPAVMPDGGEDVSLGQVLVHMRTHFAEPLSNATLAEIAGRSVRAFERMFRRQLNVTPQQFLRRLRVRLACQELTASRRPLSAIAATHGFYDQSHFVREFRREYRLTPGEYRDRHGAGSARGYGAEKSRSGRHPVGKSARKR